MKNIITGYSALTLTLLLIAYIVYVQILFNHLDDNINHLLESKKSEQPVMLLSGFKVKAQEKPYSCGLATITMIYSYLIENTNEAFITDLLNLEKRASGMMPYYFSKKLQEALPDYTVTHFSNRKDSQVVELIINSLQNGFPAAINYSTVNILKKPETDTHLSAIIGYDLNNKTFTIANAYGMIEVIPISELLKMLKYENHVSSPFLFDIAVFLNIQGKNNIILIEK